MAQRSRTFKESIQKLYLASSSFLSNDLFTYAAAGAYSFFLSALPIVLMVLAVLLRILDESPAMVRDILARTPVFDNTLSLDAFFDSVLSFKSVGLFEVIIGVSIFWMARRFFASIQQSMRIIYKKRGKAKPVKENLVIIAGEVFLVILVTATVTIVIAGRTFLSTAYSEAVLDPVIWKIVSNLYSVIPGVVLWLFLFMVYYVTPRTRPAPLLSAAAAAACTASFTVVQFVSGSFINMSRYNLVYGILSNVIVMLLEVYLFFVLMLFFAQFQYVSQFFDSFLLAELYLLPPKEERNLLRKFERKLFIDAPSLRRRHAVSMPIGEVIFDLGDESKEIYYICNGCVALYQKDRIIELSEGSVFGEFSGVLNSTRTATAICRTDCELLKLPEQLFTETLEVDAAFSRRTLQTIADYVRKKNAEPLSTDE